jgi:phosphoglycerate dehydrogenase-like enzyme
MSPVATSSKPRVFCLYAIDPAVEAQAGQYFDLTCFPDPAVKQWKTQAEGIMVRGETITPEDVNEIGGQLKFLSKHGVGLDRIATDELKARGIVVMNTPGVNVSEPVDIADDQASAVAELALTLALCVARNVPQIDRRIRNGEIVPKVEGASGLQLSSSTLGLIGGGNIGYQLGKMFYGAFNSKVTIYDPHLPPTVLAKWTNLLPSTHLTIVHNLEDLLKSADVVSIHVPLLDSTRDLIGEKELRSMKSSAVLINTARGGIVNEPALLQALEEGWILGAGIDAYSVEPPTLDDFKGLISHPRVVST